MAAPAWCTTWTSGSNRDVRGIGAFLSWKSRVRGTTAGQRHHRMEHAGPDSPAGRRRLRIRWVLERLPMTPIALASVSNVTDEPVAASVSRRIRERLMKAGVRFHA